MEKRSYAWLLEDPDMSAKAEMVTGFIGEQVPWGLNPECVEHAAHHLACAIEANPNCEPLWKAFVILDELIDRWEEFDAVNKESEGGS